MFESAELGHRIDKATYDAEVPQLREDLLNAQFDLAQKAKFPVIILIGGVGTLQGALVGAVVYRLLDFGLRRYMGESASFINGAVYVAFVLFIPFGIVGTWRLRSLRIKQGWERLLQSFPR